MKFACDKQRKIWDPPFTQTKKHPLLSEHHLPKTRLRAHENKHTMHSSIIQTHRNKHSPHKSKHPHGDQHGHLLQSSKHLPQKNTLFFAPNNILCVETILLTTPQGEASIPERLIREGDFVWQERCNQIWGLRRPLKAAWLLRTSFHRPFLKSRRSESWDLLNGIPLLPGSKLIPRPT